MARIRFQDALHRMAAYQALSELFAGKSVLEVGCGAGDGLRLLFALGAREVLGVDEDIRAARARVQGLGPQVDVHAIRRPRLWVGEGVSFDRIVVADVAQMAGWAHWVTDLKERLAPGGTLILRALSGDDSSDAAGGIPYGDLLDWVEGTFQTVRVFGQAPFAGFGVVELGGDRDPEDLPLSLDLSLLGGEAETVSTYLVVCSDGEIPALDELGLAVVQVPMGGEATLDRWWDAQGAEGSGSPEDSVGWDATRSRSTLPEIAEASAPRSNAAAQRAPVEKEAPVNRRDPGQPEEPRGARQARRGAAPATAPSVPLEAYLDGSGGRPLRWGR